MELANKLGKLKSTIVSHINRHTANALLLNAKSSYKTGTNNAVHWMSNFLTSNRKVLLLLGEAGSGKTTTCMQFIKCLIQDKKLSKFTPCYIDLNQTAFSDKNLLETALINNEFTSDEINQLKTNPNIIFIIDGYERLGCYKNLYIQHHMDDWQAKIIFTCSSQYFLHNDDFAVYFHPIQHGRVCADLLSIITLEPLNKDQIKDVCVLHQTTFDHEALAKSGLNELATNPLMLQMILEIFPKHHKSNKDKIFVQKTVCEELLTAWFRYYENKLKDSKQLDKNENNFIATCWQYCQALAKIMQTKKLTTIVYEAVSTLFGKEETKETKETNEWHLFFTSKKQNLHLVRSIVPIRTIQPQHHAFYSNELVTYFAGYKLNQSLTLTSRKKSATKPAVKKILSATSSNKIPSYLLNHYLNQHLIVNDSNLIPLFVDKVRASKQFENFLFNLLYASANDEAMATAGANAITILNAAKVSFAWLKLHNVRIRHAILDYGNFEGTELIGADMEGVSCKNIYMPYAKLDGANMAGVIFGEAAYLTLDSSYVFNEVANCSCSNDGRLLATATYEKILVYNLLKEKAEYELPGHEHGTQYVTFHPNNQVLASGGADGLIRIWDIKTRKCLEEISKHIGIVSILKYSKDGSYLATSGEDGQIFIWETKNYTCVLTLNNYYEYIYDLDFNSSNTSLVSVDAAGGIKIWNLLAGTCKQAFVDGSFATSVNENNIPATTVHFSPDDNWLVAGNDEGEIYLFNLSNHYVKLLKGHVDTINAINFSLDGKFLVTASDDNTIRLWSLEDNACVSVLPGHAQPVNCVIYSPDQRYIISTATDRTARFWPVNANLTSNSVEEGHKKEINNLQFSYDGRYLATSEIDEAVIRIWHADSGKCLYKFNGVKLTYTGDLWATRFSSGEIACLQFSQDNRYLAWSNSDVTVTVKDLVNGNQFRYSPKTDDIKTINFSRDARYLAIGGKDGALGLWETDSQTCLYYFPEPKQAINCIIFDSTNNLLACATGDSGPEVKTKDNSIYLWDIMTGKRIQHLKQHSSPVLKIAFSHNNKIIVSLDETETLKFWDIKKGHCLHTIQLDDQINSDEQDEQIASNSEQPVLVFSPDDNYLIVGSRRLPLSVWSMQNYEFVKLIDIGRTTQCTVNFSGNGNLQCASTSGGDHSVKVWQTRIETFPADDWYLLWTSLPILKLTNCSIENVRNISKEIFKLLHQRGAQGKPANIITTENILPDYATQTGLSTQPTHQFNSIKNGIAILLRDLDELKAKSSSPTVLARAYTDLACAYLLNKKYQDAVDHLTNSVELLKKETNSEYEKACNYMYLGFATHGLKNYPLAIKCLKAAINALVTVKKNLPHDNSAQTEQYKRQYDLEGARCLYELGLVYYEQTNYKEAITRLIKSYEFYKYYESHYFEQSEAVTEIYFLLINIGNTLFLIDAENSETQKCYELFELDIHHIPTQRQLAAAAFERNKLQNAMQHYEILLKFGSTQISDYHNLGCIYHLQVIAANNDSALLEKCNHVFQAGLELANENDLAIVVEYAVFHYEQKNYTEVLNYLNTVIATHQQSSSQLIYADIEKSRLPADIANAIDNDEEVVLQPRVLAYYLVIMSHLKLGNMTEAAEKSKEFNSLLNKELQPTELAWFLLGCCYQNLNDMQSAMRCFSKADQLQSKADNPIALTHARNEQTINDDITGLDIKFAQYGNSFFAQPTQIDSATVLPYDENNYIDDDDNAVSDENSSDNSGNSDDFNNDLLDEDQQIAIAIEASLNESKESDDNLPKPHV